MTAAAPTHHEPLRTTLIRNGLIAIGVGTVLALWPARSAHPLRWPVAVILVLWPTFGGHWLEVWYLDWLKPRLGGARSVQLVARIATWFLGGCMLGAAMMVTARAVGGPRLIRWPELWLAGVAFIGVELVAHIALQLRGQPSFFNGRG